jgi:hypothetical protein
MQREYEEMDPELLGALLGWLDLPARTADVEKKLTTLKSKHPA